MYIHWQLILYRDNRRQNPEMSTLAATLTDADMANLAEYYAAQAPAPSGRRPPDPEKAAAGRLAFERHHCVSCHAPGFTGRRYAPRLSGLHYEYVLHQLHGFKNQTRAELDGTMTTAAQPLTEQEIENVAHYIADVLGAEGGGGSAGRGT
jgi:cytochrome c553